MNQYQDRGMKKWAGFYLSEHSAEQEKLKVLAAHVNKPKPVMTTQEIGEVLQFAMLKNKKVAVQLEAVDCNGNYYDDIIGYWSNSNSLGIYIGTTKVDYDEIRNIEIYNPNKWSSIS